LRRFVWAGVLALLAFNLALAQDATKTEPRHYKLAFENDKVQVVYVQYGPHEKSRMHSHPQGVVVNITAAHLLFTDEDGKTHEVYSKPGEARWFPPFRHTVENLGDTAFSGVYIGVKGGPSASRWPRQQVPQPEEQAAGQNREDSCGLRCGSGGALAVRIGSDREPEIIRGTPTPSLQFFYTCLRAFHRPRTRPSSPPAQTPVPRDFPAHRDSHLFCWRPAQRR